MSSEKPEKQEKSGGLFGLGKIKGVFTRRLATAKKEEKDDSSSQSAEAEEPTPRRPDEEIMAEVKVKYYGEMDQEAVSKGIIEGLPGEVDFAWLENAIWEHERALELVSSELSQRVLASYNEFVEGMKRIHDVGVNLQQSTVICKNSRLSLRMAKASLASSALELAAKQRRRQMYAGVIEVIASVRSVTNCVRDLEGYLEAGDYEKAINTYFEANRMAQELMKLASGGLKCVEGIQRSIEKASQVLKSRLDDSLRRTCQSFKPASYEALLKAYRLMGRSFEVLNKLDEFFTADLENRSRQVVLLFLNPGSATTRDEQSMIKFKMSQAVLDVGQDHYIDCLLNLLGVCTEIMWNFHSIKRWHDDVVQRGSGSGEDQDKMFVDTRMGLERARKKIWDSMQRNVGLLIGQAQLQKYQVEDAMRIVEAVNLFVNIGREFSGKASATLQDELKKRSTSYFEDIKRSMTEDLHAMLENEQWQKVPVAIRVQDMKEFRNLHDDSAMSRLSAKVATQRSFFTAQQPNSPSTNPFYASAKSRLFVAEGSASSPASQSPKPGATAPAEGEEDEEDEDAAQELAREYIEDDDSVDTRADEQAIVTSSAINIARKVGRYLRMMQVLEPIAGDIFKGITDLYSCYLWTVWECFITATPQGSAILTGVAAGIKASSKVLEGLRDRVAERTSFDSSRGAPPATATATTTAPMQPAGAAGIQATLIEVPTPDKPEGFVAPALSARLDMNNPTNLYGLLHRVVSTESLLFLRDALNLIRPVVRKVLPESKLPTLESFYARSVDVVEDMRLYMYRNIAQHLVSLDQVPGMVEKVKWDATMFNEEQERPYVVLIKKELGMLDMRLEGLRKQGCFPHRSRTLLWEAIILHVMDVLLEGFSRIKKCTPEGRAAMDLDLQTVVTAVEQLSGLHPAPGAYVPQAYVKAYYLKDQELLSLCRTRIEFTQKMLLNLFQCNLSSQLPRKQRSELQTAIEELSKNRQRRPLWQYVPAEQLLLARNRAHTPKRSTKSVLRLASSSTSPPPISPIPRAPTTPQPPAVTRRSFEATPQRLSFDAQRGGKP